MSNLKIGDKVEFVVGTSLCTGTITKFYKNYYNREECSIKTEIGTYPHILLERVSKIEDSSALNEKDKQIADLQHRLNVAKKALSTAVADKCKAENIIAESFIGKGAKVTVPKKEQWYLEQAEKELKKE